jgi:hypothetical protein
MSNATMTSNEHYTYEEACKVLGVSYSQLTKAVSFETFHPVASGKRSRKYLLKSEVDAMIGKQLFTQRKPRPGKAVSTTFNQDIQVQAVQPITLEDVVNTVRGIPEETRNRLFAILLLGGGAAALSPFFLARS